MRFIILLFIYILALSPCESQVTVVIEPYKFDSLGLFDSLRNDTGVFNVYHKPYYYSNGSLQSFVWFYIPKADHSLNIPVHYVQYKKDGTQILNIKYPIASNEEFICKSFWGDGTLKMTYTMKGEDYYKHLRDTFYVKKYFINFPMHKRGPWHEVQYRTSGSLYQEGNRIHGRPSGEWVMYDKKTGEVRKIRDHKTRGTKDYPYW